MCDIQAAASIGLNLLMGTMDDDQPAPQSPQMYDAAGRAAERGIQLEENRYADQKAEFEAQRPYREKTLAAAGRKLERGEAEDVRYDALGQRVLSDATAAGSVEEQDAAAARAAGDVNAAFDATEAGRVRTLQSLGMDPTDPAAMAGDRAAGIQKTALLSQASTLGRESEKRRGEDLRRSTLATRPGFSPNVSMVNAPGGSTITSAAGTLGNLASSQANQENLATQRASDDRAAIGKMVGNVLEKASKPTPYNPGFTDTSLNNTSGGFSFDVPFKDGGMVDGPGGPTDDAVPAVIDGAQPAALSSGEFVVKADAVRKYGPKLLEEVNNGTAIIVPSKVPRTLTVVGGRGHAKAA